MRWAGWPAIDVYIPVYPCIPLLYFMHHTFKPHEAIYTLAHPKNKVIYLIPSFVICHLLYLRNHFRMNKSEKKRDSDKRAEQR